MIITSIEPQKNSQSRVSVFIDYDFAFGINKAVAEKLKLYEGDEISKERYDYILDNVVFSKAKSYALRYLAAKARTSSEIRKKLSEKEYSDSIIDRAIDFLIKYNYINDLEYCKSYIDECCRIKQKGIRLIEVELKRKGIDERIIKKAFAQCGIDELQNAKCALNKKYKNIDISDSKELARAANFLIRRGFKYDIIKEALKQL